MQGLLNIASSQKNASSPLLRLPQEIKNQIYCLVLGGNFLHISLDRRSKACSQICKAAISEEEAETYFQNGLPIYSVWNIDYGVNRHDTCYEQPGFKINLLLICHQVHIEARYIVYSANTFSFERPHLLRIFLRLLQNANPEHLLAIRSLHIRVSWQQASDEFDWLLAISPISRQLKLLRNINIDIDQGRELTPTFLQRSRTLMIEDNRRWDLLLAELGGLRVLPLKTATCVISDYGIEERWRSQPWTAGNRAPEQKYRWALKEKQARAKLLMEAFLHSRQ
jgi:hypothetical protein